MSIAERIRKIIAKADSSSHREEAESFLVKARQLMEEHGLSLLDLGRLNSDDPVGVDKYFYRGHIIDSWRQLVAGQLAAFFGCELVSTTSGANRWHSVIGRESARMTHQLMWPFVDRQVMQMAREDVKSGIYPSVNVARRRIGQQLALRLDKLNNAKKAEAPIAGRDLSGVNALVPVDLIEAAAAEAFPDLYRDPRKTKVRYDGNAKQRAEQVSLHHQAGSAAPALRLGS